MPHLSLEYSANLDDIIDVSQLADALRGAMIETGIFPLAGVRVRAIRCETYAIADGDARHGFVDMVVRLGAGRSPDAKRTAADIIFKSAEAALANVMAKHPIGLSLEMREIDPELSFKTNTIRDHLPDGA